MEKILKKLTYTLMAIAIMFIFSISLFCGGVGVTYAATNSSGVLEDLRKDPDFDESEYGYIKYDYDLHVIQIGESSNKELFVYVYQPCHDTYDLTGTKISISYGYSVNGSGLSPKLYNLRLVSTSGTLDKYYVEGFTVPNDGDRYYNIVEIFRMINTEIDGEQDESNPKTDIAYSVGQQWYVCDLNNSKHYEMNTFETMFVENVFCSYFEFEDGYSLKDLVCARGSVYSWFYCFNAEDYKIKHIFDADLNYSYEVIKSYGAGASEEILDTQANITTTLKDSDVMKHQGVGFGAKDFIWNRILSSNEFLSIVEGYGLSITLDDRAKIESSQWVFSFLETEVIGNRETASVVAGAWYQYTNVFDVGVLRLHFQDTLGKYYDLGVVNDLIDPDNTPSAVATVDLLSAFEDFWDMFVKIIFSIAGVILLVLLLNFVTPIMGILKFIFKGIVFVICAPFKLLKSIFKKDG